MYRVGVAKQDGRAEGESRGARADGQCWQHSFVKASSWERDGEKDRGRWGWVRGRRGDDELGGALVRGQGM